LLQVVFQSTAGMIRRAHTEEAGIEGRDSDG
jgi:hypothetical protein